MDTDLDKCTNERVQSEAREAEPARVIQFKDALGQMSYSEQMAAIQPDLPVQFNGGTNLGDVHQAAAEGVSGSGGTLPHLPAIQNSFGGHDVSSVKAHTGPKAEQANASLGAEAYATGNDVAFKSSPSLHTAAHEAAHIVQQRQGVSLPGGVGSVGDSYEKHADAVAERVVSGQCAADLLSGGPSGGLQAKTSAVQMTAPTTSSPSSSGSGTGSSTPSDPDREACLALLGNDEAKLTRFLAYPAINNNVDRLKKSLSHTKAAGQVDALGTLLNNRKISEGGNVLTLLRHAKVESLSKLNEVLAHAKVSNTAALIPVVRHSAFVNLAALLALLGHSEVADLAQITAQLTRLNDWTKVDLYLGPRPPYFTSKGPGFQVGHQALLDKRTAIGGGPATEIPLDELDSIKTLCVDAIDNWAPQDLQDEVTAAWPVLEAHITTWVANIQQWVQDGQTLAQGIQNTLEVSWPTGSAPIPQVENLTKALRVERAAQRAVVQAAQQAIQTAIDGAFTAAVTEARTQHTALVGGADLVPADYNRIAGRLAFLHSRGSQGQKSEVDRVSADLAGLNAVRADGRAQPQTAKGGGFGTVRGETAIFVDANGRSQATYDETQGKAEPSDAEIRRFISRQDVLQGGIADCFLAGALSSVAGTHPSLIYQAINATGAEAYTVRLFKPRNGAAPPPGGAFTEFTVAIDHKLPTDGAVAALAATVKTRSLWEWFTRVEPTKITELWVVLMEKAIAKYQGSGYRTLAQGGYSYVMLEMLTGQRAEQHPLPAPAVLQPDKDASWLELSTHINANRPATAGSDATRIIDSVGAADIKKIFENANTNWSSDLARQTGGVPPADIIAANNTAQMRTAFQNMYSNLGRGNAMRDNCIRSLGTAAGVYAWHVYSIVSVRENHPDGAPPERFVLLRNPWGVTISGADDDGDFELTFDDFLGRFGSVNYGMWNAP